MKVKTTNALMKYLREQHNISIDGSKDKKNLRNIGYYHGYKGYRYIKNPKNRITLISFDEIVSIVDFDTKLKSLLYSQIMQIETISKNCVLQTLVEEYKTDNFNDVYEYGMTDYRNYKNNTYCYYILCFFHSFMSPFIKENSAKLLGIVATTFLISIPSCDSILVKASLTDLDASFGSIINPILIPLDLTEDAASRFNRLLNSSHVTTLTVSEPISTLVNIFFNYIISYNLM